MIGTSLAALRTKVKQLIQTELSVTVTDLNSITGLLNLAQRELAVAFDWEHLHTRIDQDTTSRINTLPTTIDFDRQVRVAVKYQDEWRAVNYGITEAHYNIYDIDETQDPVQRWRRFGITQYEIWPSPATSQTIRFVGNMAFNDMSEDTDAAVLDDLLLALAVATEILTQQESKAAGFMLERYRRREAQLRRNTNIPDRVVSFDGSRYLHGYEHEFTVEEGEVSPELGPLFGRSTPEFGSNLPVFGE